VRENQFDRTSCEQPRRQSTAGVHCMSTVGVANKNGFGFSLEVLQGCRGCGYGGTTFPTVTGFSKRTAGTPRRPPPTAFSKHPVQGPQERELCDREGDFRQRSWLDQHDLSRHRPGDPLEGLQRRSSGAPRRAERHLHPPCRQARGDHRVRVPKTPHLNAL
jgi:hypothetical protein